MTAVPRAPAEAFPDLLAAEQVYITYWVGAQLEATRGLRRRTIEFNNSTALRAVYSSAKGMLRPSVRTTYIEPSIS
jgi:hypothetical protein